MSYMSRSRCGFQTQQKTFPSGQEVLSSRLGRFHTSVMKGEAGVSRNIISRTTSLPTPEHQRSTRPNCTTMSELLSTRRMWSFFLERGDAAGPSGQPQPSGNIICYSTSFPTISVGLGRSADFLKSIPASLVLDAFSS